MALGNQNHFIELSHSLSFVFGSGVKNDVISHVFVGQTLVGALVGIALDLTAADYESGEVLTGSLKQCVSRKSGEKNKSLL